MSKYIKVDDLQRYCDNQKYHSITPNEFQRMTQYDFGWHTGMPTEEGWYLVKLKDTESFGTLQFTWNNWTEEMFEKWMKIEE